MKTIGERLKHARETRKLSQPELAKLAGVTQGTIGNCEAGIRGKPRELNRIARALRIRSEWLEFGRKPMDIDAETTQGAVILSHAIQDMLEAAIEAEKEGIPLEEITVAARNFERYVASRRLRSSLHADLSTQGGERVKEIQQRKKRDAIGDESSRPSVDQETTEPVRRK